MNGLLPRDIQEDVTGPVLWLKISEVEGVPGGDLGGMTDFSCSHPKSYLHLCLR